jgi:hypothetical protein
MALQALGRTAAWAGLASRSLARPFHTSRIVVAGAHVIEASDSDFGDKVIKVEGDCVPLCHSCARYCCFFCLGGGWCASCVNCKPCADVQPGSTRRPILPSSWISMPSMSLFLYCRVVSLDFTRRKWIPYCRYEALSCSNCYIFTGGVDPVECSHRFWKKL